MTRRNVTASTLAAFALVLATATTSMAALDPGDTTWDGNEPVRGVYFHWYQPSFYTGFAPRTQDPSRLHIELARGNQLRITAALGDAELDNYLADLDERQRTYRELIDRKVIELTTNREYEAFVAGLEAQGVAAAVAGRASTTAEAWREKAVAAMTALNPGRVFLIRIPVATLAPAWHAALLAMQDGNAVSRLDAANAALPGRIHLTELAAADDAALARAIAAAKAGGAGDPAFVDAYAAFVAEATEGHYRVKDGAVTAVEFTTIYPAGTVDGTTTYKGEKLPDFGVTGVWSLMKRENGKGRLGMVDYLSTNPGYGFIPLLAYQYAGGISYNAFHNAGVRCQLDSTPFLPAAWRKAVSDRDGKLMQNLWIVGRGPTSHGCTRLPSGHMSEMRHLAPSESDVLAKVKTFRNLPQCHDVFDLDGDGRAEAMGVQYYVSYTSDEHTPRRSSASNRREPFYRWLYGANIDLGAVGSSKLKDVPVCRFVGRKAVEKETLRDVPLHEAAYVPEAIQFYTLKPASFESQAGFEFNREIRKVGAGHATNRKALFLP